MGTIIKATGISSDKTNKSSVYHAIEAGRLCVEAGGIENKDVDLLINVGIYRDENIGEPAMAALIQKGIGIKADYFRKQFEQAAFSFDLMNSSCGILNGIQVADSMLKTKKAKYAMIVSSDTHPSKKHDADFPFSCVGAAMLLEYDDNDEKGFKNIIFKNSKDLDHSLKGYINLKDTDVQATDRLTVSVPDEYNQEILEFAGNTVNDYLALNDKDRKNLKLIAPQIHEGFGKKMADSVGINDDSILDLYSEYGDAHSSALSMAYHLQCENGKYTNNDEILFVAAGAGLSSACALYTV